MTALLFLTALAMLLVGHLVRVARWMLLLRQIGRPEPGAGFLALSAAYVLNTFLPLRLGEIARVLLYALRTRADVAYVLASIIVERGFDVVGLAAVLGLLWAAGMVGGIALAWALAMAGIGIAILAAALALGASPRLRRLVWLAALPFNARIRVIVLDTAWSIREVLLESGANWARILGQSVAMWGLYLMSYRLLSLASGIGFEQVFHIIHGTPLAPSLLAMLRAGTGETALLLLYSFVPFALVLAYALTARRTGLSLRGDIGLLSSPLLYAHRSARARSRFLENEQYDGFLVRRFSGTGDLVADFEMHAIDDAVVQRMFRGGSDALTAMVRVKGALHIRKYARGAAADKLAAQYDWLARHSADLPLVRLAARSRAGRRFLYDMDYSPTSRDLFDAIHTTDTGTAWAILQDVLARIAAQHAATDGPEADDATITRYGAEKIAANLAAIRAAYPPFFAAPHVIVNGRDVDLALLDLFAAPGFLPPRLARRGTADIHGDLTIENILVDPARPGGWFLIDPNIGNVFESPLLDYAKLMQSLHLGYESLNRDATCTFGEGMLNVPILRTAQYDALHRLMTSWLTERFGPEGLREIRLHEIVHYFRLTPYKFRKSTATGLAFLGCLCLLVGDYVADYEAGLPS